ncbi:MAG TPA: SIMPL domain-containing protein [Steroidobacteraceae bacterium]|nr:SIMPL domain-containing protein [Steroidobacteraceae bacterium]
MRALLLLTLATASAAAIAQAPPRPRLPRPATIQVTGRAQASKPPDRVYIDLGVTTQAQKSEAAASENAARISAVIAAVRRAAGPGVELTTAQYSINPNYNYPRDGGTPTLVGYTVTNVVQVRLDDLRMIGTVIDGAAHAGSNNVQDIRFALRDEETPRREALREAAVNARREADTLAGALGLRVVRVLSVEEQSPAAIRPLMMYAQSPQLARAEAAPATPVEHGTVALNATVTLTVEVAPTAR